MRLLRIVSAFALIISSVSSVSAAPPLQAPPLRLHRNLLTAAFNRTAAAQALLASASDRYVIVQFAGPITLANRATLEAAGVTLLEYLPDFAYLVSCVKRRSCSPTNYRLRCCECSRAARHIWDTCVSSRGPMRVMRWRANWPRRPSTSTQP
jgi:hypothetical protein